MSDVDGFFSELRGPLLVVTAESVGERSGCLVGFATQCSIRPPRLLVCLSVLNHTYAVARAARTLGVHLLGHDQRDVASLFGEATGDAVDKFDRVRWRTGIAGTPMLLNCSAWIEGAIRDRHTLGDHDGFVLVPLAAGIGDAPGILPSWWARTLRAGHPA